ncbi:MAG: enoyl-CoA hydratase-related protein [Wenzhouxiangellaceae bacterium]|nr:enoyl-CoA hydratase-related protein [Wenzhouxiangellaceae bacterium]
MTFKNLVLEHRGPVTLVTVNRPEKLNALNGDTIAQLQQAIDFLAERHETRAVVLTGAGSKAFVAGADISEIREQSPTQAHALSSRGQALMRRIESLPKPVIAAINGFALGGGLELALACHLRYASSTARMGLPEIKLGLLPGFGGTQRLTRLIGRSRALEMMLVGEPIDAATAKDFGLINHLCEPQTLVEDSLQMAQQLAAAAPEAIAAILQSVDLGLGASIDQGLALESARFSLCCSTPNMREGTLAFLEKRKADFS